VDSPSWRCSRNRYPEGQPASGGLFLFERGVGICYQGFVRIAFAKYHALFNDFIVIESHRRRLSRVNLSELAAAICDRRPGVGADGILYLASGPRGDVIDIYNADGSWAEKSGNGLRIAALHRFREDRRRRSFTFLMNGLPHRTRVLDKADGGMLIRTDLGTPEFESARVPIRTRRKHMINAPLKLAGLDFPVTCLSVGNPHTVLFVKDFDFDWKQLGSEIEVHRAFPNHTNVEFVKVATRRRIRVADWERGAGATGSSGTGAAAAVCAAVMLGLVDRECEVQFETGSLFVKWNEVSNLIELTGPAVFVAEGEFALP